MFGKKKIKVGDIYLSCDYHPVFCTESDGDDLWGISLVDGHSPCGCSVENCGPKKMTIKEAVELKNLWYKGEREVMKFFGWTDPQIDDFMKNWRQGDVKEKN